MAKIRVDLNHAPRDGETVAFKAPCDASSITGLVVYYADGDVAKSKDFTLTDAHGGNIGVLNNIFAKNAIVKVILDTDKNNAFIQNADTNTYLENRFSSLKPSDIGAATNPHLEDNWYFANPVNQRGNTEYNRTSISNKGVYTIDRWRSRNGKGNVALVEGGILIECSATDYHLYFEQDIIPTLAEKILVLSFLIDDVEGEGYVQAHYLDGGFNTAKRLAKGLVTSVIPAGKSVDRILIQLNKATNAKVKLRAVKLEYGTVQTLAHQDASGNWVLNDVPNYAEELLKCCLNTADSSDTYANNLMTASAFGAAPTDHTHTADDVSGVAKEDHTHSLTELGAANKIHSHTTSDITGLDSMLSGYSKIATGSYVGTGTYGKDNPNTLIFDFTPEVVVITGGAGMATFLRGQSNPAYLGNFSIGHSCVAVWEANSLSWYATDMEYGVPASAQGNTTDVTYSWFALGKEG